MPSLSHMPEVVMKNILGKVGFQSIMTLRKVSQGFRRFIDETISDSQFDFIKILFNQNELSIFFMDNFEMKQIRYSSNTTGCFVKFGRVNRLESIDFITAFFNDFELILRHQKSLLQKFTIKVINGTDDEIQGIFLKRLRSALKKNPLKVKHIDIAFPKQTDFLEIFKCFDMEYLEKIELIDSKYSYEGLELDDIKGTEQWKMCRNVCIWYFTIKDDLDQFFNFSNVNISLESVNSKDLVLLKTHAIHSPIFESFFISYKTFVDDIVKCFGDPYFSDTERYEWYAKTVRTEKLLKIVQFPSLKNIHFYHVDSCDVPQVVLDYL